MNKEGSDITRWLGNNPLRDSLSRVGASYVPDDSFRNWKDTAREAPLCHYDRMSDEHLAESYAPLRSPRHIATVLLLQHTNARTLPEIVRELNSRLEDGNTIYEPRIREAINDLVTTSYVSVDKALGGAYRYEPAVYFPTLAAQAGYLGTFVEKYEIPPVNILGADERGVSANKGSQNGIEGKVKAQYTVDRIKIIREIQKTKVYQGAEQSFKGLPLSLTTLSRQLDIPLQQTRGHLDALIRSGFINKQSMTPGESYQVYNVNPDAMDQLGDSDNKGNVLTKIFTQELRDHPEGITSDAMFETLSSKLSAEEPLSEEQLQHLKTYIQRRLMKLAKNNKLLRSGQFSFDRRSTIILNPFEGQIHKMRDLTLTLLMMQEAEQPRRESEGLELGDELLDNSTALTRVVIGAQQNGRWSRQAPEDQLYLYDK